MKENIFQKRSKAPLNTFSPWVPVMAPASGEDVEEISPASVRCTIFKYHSGTRITARHTSRQERSWAMTSLAQKKVVPFSLVGGIRLINGRVTKPPRYSATLNGS